MDMSNLLPLHEAFIEIHNYCGFKISVESPAGGTEECTPRELTRTLPSFFVKVALREWADFAKQTFDVDGFVREAYPNGVAVSIPEPYLDIAVKYFDIGAFLGFFEKIYSEYINGKYDDEERAEEADYNDDE